MPYRAVDVTCGTCRQPMALVSVHGRDMRMCDECGGLWCDGKELMELIRDTHPSKHISELMLHNDGSPRRPCPVCGERMDLAWIDFLKLDQCLDHGVWLDAGELERILAWDVGTVELPPQQKKRAPPALPAGWIRITNE